MTATARTPLTGIVVALGARTIRPDRPTVDEARQLLAHSLDVDRVRVEPDAVVESATRADGCRSPWRLRTTRARAHSGRPPAEPVLDW